MKIPSLLNTKVASLLGTVACFAGLAAGCGQATTGPPLATVEKVDLDQYVGKWFEVARYPNAFEEGCAGVTAEYAARDDGTISVLNTCQQGGLGGPPRDAEAFAVVQDETTNAKLTVYFFFPFGGDYWIIDLDENYQWAVVGDPNRQFLWVLSRTPQLDEETYQSILSRLPEKGYDADRLELTPQPIGIEG